VTREDNDCRFYCLLSALNQFCQIPEEEIDEHRVEPNSGSIVVEIVRVYGLRFHPGFYLLYSDDTTSSNARFQAGTIGQHFLRPELLFQARGIREYAQAVQNLRNL
jgi:hypothetical protein